MKLEVANIVRAYEDRLYKHKEIIEAKKDLLAEIESLKHESIIATEKVRLQEELNKIAAEEREDLLSRLYIMDCKWHADCALWKADKERLDEAIIASAKFSDELLLKTREAEDHKKKIDDFKTRLLIKDEMIQKLKKELEECKDSEKVSFIKQ